MAMTHRLVYSAKSFNLSEIEQSPKHFSTSPFQFPLASLRFFTLKPLIRSVSAYSRLPSDYPRPQSSSRYSSKIQFLNEILDLFAFSVILLCLRLFSNVILPHFPHRWRALVAYSEEAEARTSAYPSHVWQAIVAYEDRWFFRHFGIDPIGVARAVLSFSASGGGSTITQQVYCSQLFIALCKADG